MYFDTLVLYKMFHLKDVMIMILFLEFHYYYTLEIKHFVFESNPVYFAAFQEYNDTNQISQYRQKLSLKRLFRNSHCYIKRAAYHTRIIIRQSSFKGNQIGAFDVTNWTLDLSDFLPSNRDYFRLFDNGKMMTYYY